MGTQSQRRTPVCLHENSIAVMIVLQLLSSCQARFLKKKPTLQAVQTSCHATGYLPAWWLKLVYMTMSRRKMGSETEKTPT